MTLLPEDVRFPEGSPTPFQVAAITRLSELLREEGIMFDEFRLNVGAKRGFWTSFVLRGKEHILAVYPDELNVLNDRDLYENYLPAEFVSETTLLDSFMRRLRRLVREGTWELPEEGS